MKNVVLSPERSRSTPYPLSTIMRADRAMRCAPFQLKLFVAMQYEGISLQSIADQAGVQNQYTRQLVQEWDAENSLMWLIAVGLLRREVDGQGLTDSFRLTPLGRYLVEKWQVADNTSEYRPNWRDRWLNTLTRWLRLPF
jgi:hypothetical protein